MSHSSSSGGNQYSVEDLLHLMRRLRDPVDGCPWDVKQDYRSIAPSTIEEAYEVVDAIEGENYLHLKEELGDLLFQVVFYSQIGTEEGRFTFEDVISDLVTKLILRHPHVFPENTLQSRADFSNRNSTDVAYYEQWEQIKKQERLSKGQSNLLDDVPVALPALTRAVKLQKRASSVGFDWPDTNGVVDKIDEELSELKAAIKSGCPQEINEELGDLMFSIVNLCRHVKTEPESALRATNRKFEQRFQYIERILEQRNTTLDAASLELMDELWDESKGESKAQY